MDTLWYFYGGFCIHYYPHGVALTFLAIMLMAGLSQPSENDTFGWAVTMIVLSAVWPVALPFILAVLAVVALCAAIYWLGCFFGWLKARIAAAKAARAGSSTGGLSVEK